jgi:hypothetical protein
MAVNNPWGSYRLPNGFPITRFPFKTLTLPDAVFDGKLFTGCSDGYYGSYRYVKTKKEYVLVVGIKQTANTLEIFDECDKCKLTMMFDADMNISVLAFETPYADIIIDWTKKLIMHVGLNQMLVKAYGETLEVDVKKGCSFNMNINLRKLDKKQKFYQNESTILLPYDYKDGLISSVINNGEYLMKITQYHAWLEQKKKLDIKVDKPNIVHEIKKIEENSEDNYGQCTICMYNKSNFILDKCGHLVYCEDCAKQNVLLCPVCRIENTNMKKIFIP